MARLTTNGAEVNDALSSGALTLDTVILTGTGGFATVSTTVKRTGSYAYKGEVSGAVTRNSIYVESGANSAGVTYYKRGYIHIVSAIPGEQYYLFGDETHYHIRINSGGTLQLYWNTSAIGSASAAIVADTWYRIELMLNEGSGASDDSAEFRLDGVTVASETGATRGTGPGTPYYMNWGPVDGTVTGTATMYCDDCCINDTTDANQNTWPGEGAVVLLKPTSDNAVHTNWTGGSGGTSDLFRAVDNTPPIGVAAETDLTQIEHAGGAGAPTDAYDANMTTYVTAGLTLKDEAYWLSSASITAQNFGANAVQARRAQSFVAAGNANSVVLFLAKVGAPTDNLEVVIQADSAGSPSGTDLGTVVATGGASLTTSLVETRLTTGATLTIGNTYWIVGRRSGAVDAANYYALGGSASGGYAGGAGKTYNGTTWDAVTPEVCFGVHDNASATVNLVQLVAAHGEDVSTGAKLLAFSLVSNPGVVTSGNVTVGDASPAALGTYPTEWGIHRGTVMYTPQVGISAAPIMRALRPETASRVASCCAMFILVDYTPAAAPYLPSLRISQAVKRAAYW